MLKVFNAEQFRAKTDPIHTNVVVYIRIMNLKSIVYALKKINKGIGQKLIKN
jgi:hypothetical protein